MKTTLGRLALTTAVVAMVHDFHAAPFNGAPFVVPCLIEAEDFDTGGDGVGYHMGATPITPNPYRSDAVAISARSPLGATNGYVTELAVGEWCAYSIDVPEAGGFTIELWGEYLWGFGRGVLRLDLVSDAGVNTVATFQPPGPASHCEESRWASAIALGVSLPAGSAQLRLIGVSASNASGRQARVDWMRITRFSPLRSWAPLAGGDTAGFADGSGASARFAGIVGLATDNQGHLYVADAGNRRIRQVTPDGTVTTSAGTGGAGTQDGPGGQATFEDLLDLAVAGPGDVLVLDGTRIRKLDAAGIVSTVATLRIPTGDHSYRTNNEFGLPYEHIADEYYRVSQLAIGGDGRVYLLGSAVSGDEQCWQGPYGPKCNIWRTTRSQVFVEDEGLGWRGLVSCDLLFTQGGLGAESSECGSTLIELSPASGAGSLALEAGHCYAGTMRVSYSWALLECSGTNQPVTVYRNPDDYCPYGPTRVQAFDDGRFLLSKMYGDSLVRFTAGGSTEAIPGTWPTNALVAVGPRQEVYLATSNAVYRYIPPHGPPFVGLEVEAIARHRVRLRLTGPPGLPLRLEESPDLRQWTPLQDFPMTDGAADLEVACVDERRFYRLSEVRATLSPSAQPHPMRFRPVEPPDRNRSRAESL